MLITQPKPLNTAGKTYRVIFTCKACKHAWAFDYKGNVGGGKMRKDEQGTYIRYMDDFLGGCPKCGAHKVKSSHVQGRYAPEHTCDGRCEAAKGPDCECSCGGANHGKKYL